MGGKTADEIFLGGPGESIMDILCNDVGNKEIVGISVENDELKAAFEKLQLTLETWHTDVQNIQQKIRVEERKKMDNRLGVEHCQY